jgi:hypothetical protein
MADKKSKIHKKKRLSKGLRLHIRRLKQEARKEGIAYRPPIIKRDPAKAAES